MMRRPNSAGRKPGFNWKKAARKLGNTEQHNSRKKEIDFLWMRWNTGIKTRGIFTCPPCFLKGKIHFSSCTFFHPRAPFPFGNRVQFPVQNPFLEQKAFPGLPAATAGGLGEDLESHNRLGNKRGCFSEEAARGEGLEIILNKSAWTKNPNFLQGKWWMKDLGKGISGAFRYPGSPSSLRSNSLFFTFKGTKRRQKKKKILLQPPRDVFCSSLKAENLGKSLPCSPTETGKVTARRKSHLHVLFIQYFKII